jgi:hypothetical protein
VLLCIVKAPGRVWTLSLATSLAAASHHRTPPYRTPRPALARRTARFGPSLRRTVSLPHSPGATRRARHGQAAPTTLLAQRCRGCTGPHVDAVSRPYRGLGTFGRARTTSPSHPRVYKAVAALFARDRAATIRHGRHLGEHGAPAGSTAIQSSEALP